MIKIFDTTLRDGEQAPGNSMNVYEKVNFALQLEALGVDVIEAGFAISSPQDFQAIVEIGKALKTATVASLARTSQKDIEAAGEALKFAKNPRIHTFIATSPIHMEYKLNMTPEQVKQRTYDMVKLAKTYCDDVEFSAEDALRSERPFLAEIYSLAIKAGATTISIPDTVGYTTPEEIKDLISYLKVEVEGINDVTISVHCHNDLGLAVANSLAAIEAGAKQVECTINGIGERAGNASLEEIVMALHTRANHYQETTNINTQEIYRTSKLLQTITGVVVPPNKAIIGENAFLHESGIHQHGVMKNPQTYEIMTPESIGIINTNIVLGKHSGKHALEDKIKDLGYYLNAEELNHIFDKFKIIAEKKKEVSDRDIEALLNNEKINIPEVYTLHDFVVNSGTSISGTAMLKLKKDGELIDAIAVGTGPIDAAFKAIESVANTGGKLENYSIHSVTKGKDALGEGIVKLNDGINSVTGRGLSTDIIEASIQAYINGVNKLLALK